MIVRKRIKQRIGENWDGIVTMVNKLTNIIIIVAGLFATPTFATDQGDRYLTLWGASYHANRSSGECEFNFGIGYQQFISNHTYVSVGAFRNSPCNFAPYVVLGYEIDLTENSNFGLGVFGGLVGGYTEDNFESAPILPGLPYLRLGSANDEYHAKLIVIPSNEPILALILNKNLNNATNKRTLSLETREQPGTGSQEIHTRLTWHW